jgi:predicted amidophosphoribosyltransferase
VEWRNLELRTKLRRPNQELNVFSFTYYTPTAQKIILSAKESHITFADQLLVDALTETVRRFIKDARVDLLIPIPSRKGVTRKRGRQFVGELTERVACELAIPTRSMLRHRRNVRDQSALNGEERWNNLEGALVIEGVEDFPSDARVLLVDDLATTGATLLEAARAVNYAGIEVIGGVTAALAKPLR